MHGNLCSSTFELFEQVAAQLLTYLCHTRAAAQQEPKPTSSQKTGGKQDTAVG